MLNTTVAIFVMYAVSVWNKYEISLGENVYSYNVYLLIGNKELLVGIETILLCLNLKNNIQE